MPFWSDFGWLNANVITISANVISLMVLGVHRFFSSNTSRWSSITYGSGNVSGSNFDTISAIFNTIPPRSVTTEKPVNTENHERNDICRNSDNISIQPPEVRPKRRSILMTMSNINGE
jgi:hypothetical protein